MKNSQIQFKRAKKIAVSGATSPEGVPYVRIKACGKVAYVPLADFSGSGRNARDKLEAAKIVLLNSDWARVMVLVDDIGKFPLRPIIVKPGWAGDSFALPDGSVFSPPDSSKPVVLFNKEPGKCHQQGSLKGWNKGLAVLVDQSLIIFLLAAAFAAPLLRIVNRMGNIGFELAGPKGVGKSTVQRLVAAVVGGGVEQPGSNYWISANTTSNGLEAAFPEHNDLPMILEELNLFAAGEAERNRATKIDELVFRLSDGTTKARYGGERQCGHRFVYIASTNEPLAQVLLGYRKQVSDAAADRLLTLPLDDRKLGIFDKLPGGWASARDLAEHLDKLIAKHHGIAMQEFLQRLVEERASDEAALRARLEKSMAIFRKKVGVDENNGSATRVADAFGLSFAAGRLAQEYGVLPSEFRCNRAAKLAYELNRSTAADAPSMKQRLLKLAKATGVIRINREKLRKIDDATLKAAPALLRLDAKGRVELLLTSAARDRAFPVPRFLFQDQEVAPMSVRDGDGRRTVKRALRSNKGLERVYCFRLPPDAL